MQRSRAWAGTVLHDADERIAASSGHVICTSLGVGSLYSVQCMQTVNTELYLTDET